MTTATDRAQALETIRERARYMRKDIVDMVYGANSGHPGGSLSSADILATLYTHVLRHDPANPHWPDRDRFIMSKGHASPLMYAALGEAGYFDKALFSGFRHFGSILQGHNDSTQVPGVEMSAGSLGMGLAFGMGHAIAGKLDGKAYRVYVLLGDGECEEGEIWETAMSAPFHKLDTLTAIVDRNHIQNDDFVEVTTQLDPLPEKWAAFGWHVEECDGHDPASILDAIDKVRAVQGKPQVIIAHTIKGKGVSYMENNPVFHGRAPDKEQYALAMQELGF